MHGTNNSLIEANVAYNVWGFAFYLEDGNEENNMFRHNFAGHVHPIFRPANGVDGSQQGEEFRNSSELLIPADTSASGYYISNSYNSFIGNAGSGGWSVFAAPTLDHHLGMSLDTPSLCGNTCPRNRPLGVFQGNTAHSAGFYWKSHGSCIYSGARLRKDGNDLVYLSGRYEHKPMLPNGVEQWWRFQNTKVAACNKGIAHWGDRLDIESYEAHDIMISAMLFGESSVSWI